MNGTIERIIPDQGFGFIKAEDGHEFFFHRTGLMSTDFEALARGSRVEFRSVSSDEGDEPGELPRAVNVRLANGEMPAVDHEPLPREKARGGG